MGFSRRLSIAMAKYLIGNRLRGVKRFPLVLILEPTLRCNLACAGCGRIKEYRHILDKMMTVEECLSAVDETSAPVVSITGGEPLIHPDIDKIVAGIIARTRFVYLCTNGLLLEKSLEKFKPGPHMSFELHLDGLAESHNRFAGRPGVFETAIRAMRAAKAAGFQVRINTTFYKASNLSEIKGVFELVSQIPVDGIMLSPAFSYDAVTSDVFLSREEIASVFQPIYELRKKYRFYNTPTYLDFLAGKRSLKCVPWSTPTRNPIGWKQPCYLITDGHCQTFRDLMDETSWGKYGVGNDPRCSNCMVHCGFEASAINEVSKNLPNLWRTLKWNFFGG